MAKGDNQDPELHRKQMLEYWASGKAAKRKKVPREVQMRIGAENSIRNKGRYTRKSRASIQEINKFVDMIKRNPLTIKGIENIHAKFFHLRSPTNIVYHFKNLSHFVREHPDLFHPDDVVWVKKKYNTSLSCRAVNGLQMISPRKRKPVGSWKGWTWYSATEEKLNDGQDLLNRKLVYG